jgi:hypothetical protein
MRLGYADPPYPGQAWRLYRDHPDYAGEVDHAALVAELGGFDGWVLHTSSPALGDVLGLITAAGITGYRIGSWVKPFAAFKRNIPVAYAWEPVIFKPARPATVHRLDGLVSRDWISEPITLRRKLAGAKPERVAWWCFEIIGADPADNLVDMYPGTGAVSAAWETWRARLELPTGRGEQASLFG